MTKGRLLLLVLMAGFAVRSCNAQYLITGPVVVQGGVNYFASSAATDAYTGTLPRSLGTYTAGTCFLMRADVANTDAASVNVDSIGVKDLRQVGGAILETNSIRPNGLVFFCYNGPSDYMEVMFSTGGGGGGGGGDDVLGRSLLINDNLVTKVHSLDGTITESQILDNGAQVGIGTVTPTLTGTGILHVAGNTVRPFDASRVPASSTAPGNPGEIATDLANYIYVCVAPNVWRRAALMEF